MAVHYGPVYMYKRADGWPRVTRKRECRLSWLLVFMAIILAERDGVWLGERVCAGMVGSAIVCTEQDGVWLWKRARAGMAGRFWGSYCVEMYLPLITVSSCRCDHQGLLASLHHGGCCVLKGPVGQAYMHSCSVWTTELSVAGYD